MYGRWSALRVRLSLWVMTCPRSLLSDSYLFRILTISTPSPLKCIPSIRLRYWWSVAAGWAPSCLWESQTQWCWEEIHSTGEGVVSGCALPMSMEALSLGIETTSEDRQRGCELLSYPKSVYPQLARWQEFLTEFDLALEYKPGRTNKVADALNRKAKLAALTADKQRSVSQLTSTLHQRIRKGLESSSLDRFGKEGEHTALLARWWTLVTRSRLYVPKTDGAEKGTHKRVPWHSMGWTSGNWTNAGIVDNLVLLASAHSLPFLLSDLNVKVGLDVLLTTLLWADC